METKSALAKISDLSMEPMIPVNLILNGKGLVHKLVDAEPDMEDIVLLQQVLPNAKLEDFYLDKVPATDGKLMVSILRKDKVDPVLKEFTELGLYVVSIAFGPFVLQSVRTLLDRDADDNWALHMAGHHLEYESGKIVSYQPESSSEAQVEIGGERIDEAVVIPFAAAFEFLFQRSDERSTEVPAIKSAR
ncbi:MAG: hypothetical protein JKY52_16785, partial [Flavobacteriales bacterium]|nr:hypothetical protein [Flavobacteriales bacterium]